MIYTLIRSLLIEKPFYLLRPKLFISNSVRVYRYICEIFSNFMSREWGFWSPVLSRGKGFCTQWLSLGRVFASFESCPGREGWFWMKLMPSLYWCCIIPTLGPIVQTLSKRVTPSNRFTLVRCIFLTRCQNVSSSYVRRCRRCCSFSHLRLTVDLH